MNINQPFLLKPFWNLFRITYLYTKRIRNISHRSSCFGSKAKVLIKSISLTYATVPNMNSTRVFTLMISYNKPMMEISFMEWYRITGFINYFSIETLDCYMTSWKINIIIISIDN
ncbi:hypothetical protein QL285_071122 [Trifolium repens]|nr:hypothetical protein QL285_071122 [Trifolium repens]